MVGEKRLFGLIALVLGIVAGILILLDVQAKQNINLLNVIAGIGVLYGSYLIYRGKTSILFGWGKTRLGSLANLAIGVFTLLIPGGVGGITSVLAIVGGILGFLSARPFRAGCWRQLPECLLSLLDRAAHRVADAFQLIEELLGLVRRHGPF